MEGWFKHKDSVYWMNGDVKTNQIAAFDFDGTLIRSNRGLVIPRITNDWVTTYESVFNIFQDLINKEYTIVIFSNQRYNTSYMKIILSRFKNFLSKAKETIPDFSPWIFLATKDDKYRKPMKGMWELFLTKTDITPASNSFYCGDAVGSKSKNPLYRWADTDKIFSKTIKLDFLTPEDVFPPISSPEIIPRDSKDIILIVAPYNTSFEYYFDDIMRSDEGNHYIYCNLEHAQSCSDKGCIPVIIDKEFCKKAGRSIKRIRKYLNEDVRVNIYWFTLPPLPFITDLDKGEAETMINYFAKYFNGFEESENEYVTRIN